MGGDSARMLNTLLQWKFVPDQYGTTYELAFGHTFLDRMVRVEMGCTDVMLWLMTGDEVPLWSVRLQGAPYSLFRANLELMTAAAELHSEKR